MERPKTLRILLHGGRGRGKSEGEGKSEVGDGYDVAVCIKYFETNFYTIIEAMRERGTNLFIVDPMYLQYASSATNATNEILYKAAAKLY